MIRRYRLLGTRPSTLAVRALVAGNLLIAGCSSDKPHQPHAVQDEHHLGLVAISVDDSYLDKGLLGQAASPDEPAPAAAAPVSVAMDLASPEGAARTYVDLINVGQLSQLANVLVPDQQPLAAQIAEPLAPLGEAAAQLNRVLTARFPGHAIVLDIQTPGIPADWLKHWTLGPVETDATNPETATATLQVPDSAETTIRQLMQVDGMWRVREVELPLPETVQEAQPTIMQLAEALRGLTARIESGELPDAPAAQQEIEAVLANPGAAPAPAPDEGAQPTAATPPPSGQPDRPESMLEQQMDNAAGRALFGAP